MSRLEQIIPTGIIAAVGIWVAWVSYTQQPSEAFLFPRIFSGVFVALSLLTLFEAILGKGAKGSGLSISMVKNFAPGVIIMMIRIPFGITRNRFGFITICVCFDSDS